MRSEGVPVERLVSLPTAPHLRNRGYVQTKQRRLGHRAPGGEPVAGDGFGGGDGRAVDATALLGDVGVRPGRPYVVLKYAQSLDGRIATGGGDSKWISGPQERRVAHALRAACDAVLVGAGTVLADDPLLTVRMVPGASPIRVVLDSGLRVPPDAQVFGPEAATIVLAATGSDPDRREALRQRGVKVEVVPEAPGGGVDLAAGLERLLALGIRCLLVEGGSRVLTSALRARLADRLVVAVAPVLLGAGTDAVGDLGAGLVSDGLRLVGRSVHQVGPDLLVAGDLDWPAG
jgi:3,4-dihydroxy 2-butanone 4-phosphate synthase/GTP cyclohydrolase II